MRKSYIEMQRFVACCIIMIFHINVLLSKGSTTTLFRGGYIWTEFFFILTGAFTNLHIRNNKHNCDDRLFPIQYTIKKIFCLFPYVIIGTALQIVINIIMWRLSFSSVLKYLIWFPIQISMLQMFGITPDNLNVEGNVIPIVIDSPLWYISAVVVALPIVIIFITKIEKKYAGASFYFAMILTGISIMKYDVLGSVYDSFGNIVYSGVLRAFGGMLLGVAASNFGKYISEKQIKNRLRRWMFVLELGLYLGCVILTIFFDRSYNGAIFLYMFLFVAITLSEKTVTSHFSNKFVNFLGKLSLPVYCFHLPIAIFVTKWDIPMVYKYIYICLSTIILGIISIFMINWTKKWKKKKSAS